MARVFKHLALLLSLALVAGCGCDDEEASIVALVVDQAVWSGTESGRSQFGTDLENDGYQVVEIIVDSTDPPAIRSYLRGLHEASDERLEGVILVGNIPRAYQWVTLTSANPSIPDTEEEVISYQYYSDLDGVFDASPGYESPGGNAYSYDQHTGDVDWEIWVGVLPLLNGDTAQTVTALNQYFDRNHDYRTAGSAQPRSLLLVTEHYQGSTTQEHQDYLTNLQTGQYAWTPWSASGSAQLYFDTPPIPFNIQEGYTALAAGTADFFVGSAHGSPNAHGSIGLQWVAENPVATSFFWSNGCAVGKLEVAPNFLTAVLYDTDGSVVVARGTTNNSGGMGTNQEGFFGHNVATKMQAGMSIGEAIVGHVNVPLIAPWDSSREFHYATSVMLGDPSLGVPPAPTPSGPAAACPCFTGDYLSSIDWDIWCSGASLEYLLVDSSSSDPEPMVLADPGSDPPVCATGGFYTADEQEIALEQAEACEALIEATGTDQGTERACRID